MSNKKVTNETPENKFKKERSRKWFFLLYEEDETHKKALDKLIEEDGVNLRMAYIKHDKDVYSEEENPEKAGQTKKEHIHVYVELPNAVWNSALSSKLGIAMNYMETVRKDDSALEYLMHYGDSDDNKYQYPLDEVKGTLKQRLAELITKDGKSEGERVMELFEFIENSGCVLTVTEVSKFAALNGYWSVFRRSSSLFVSIILEHNNKIKLLSYQEPINNE